MSGSGLNEAAQVAAMLHAAGVDPREHHTRVKKKWAEVLPDFDPKRMPMLMDGVRTELHRLAKETPVVDFSDLGPQESEHDRAWREAGERARIERERAAATLLEDRKREARERLERLKEQKDRERAEERQAREDEKISQQELDNTNESETTMTTATMKKPSKSKKTSKAAPKRAPKPKMTKTEILADLQKRYPHVVAVSEWNDETGRPVRVEIKCPKLTAECTKKREIWAQDAFQVKTCEACKSAAKKIAKHKAKK